MSWRNHSFGGCLVVTDLLTAVWAKVIGLLFFKGFSPTTVITDLLPLLTSPCSWPSPIFSGCWHRNYGIGSWQKSRMEMWRWERTMSDRSATTKTNAFSIQDKSRSGERLLLTVVPALLVVVNHESMVLSAALATTPDWGARAEARLIFGIAFFFIISFLTPPAPISQPLCSQVNVTNLHSCWFLWALQVLQREVGLSVSTEESRLPRAEEWQKCPHVFCLWHRCWWESFYHTARPVHATLTRVLQMFPLSLACCGLLGFSLPSSFVS